MASNCRLGRALVVGRGTGAARGEQIAAADRRSLWPVLYYRVRRARVVWLYLPAKRVDLGVHVVRKGH